MRSTTSAASRAPGSCCRTPGWCAAPTSRTARWWAAAARRSATRSCALAFGEAACLFLRSSDRAKRWKDRQLKKRGEGKALAILAARLARAVYHLWRKGEAFDENRFWGTSSKGKTGSSSLLPGEE